APTFEPYYDDVHVKFRAELTAVIADARHAWSALSLDEKIPWAHDGEPVLSSHVEARYIAKRLTEHFQHVGWWDKRCNLWPIDEEDSDEDRPVYVWKGNTQ